MPEAEFRKGWFVLFLAGLAGLIGATAFVIGRGLAGWELSLFRFINNWPDSLRPFFLAATIVPHSLWIGVAAVAVTFLLKMYRLSWQLAAGILAAAAAVTMGKHFIDRLRPEGLADNVYVRIHEAGNGFPSGHTTIITVVVLTLWPYLPRGWRWLVFLLIPAMALSRVYLGVHSPLDVVAGFALGATVVAGLRVLPAAVRHFFRFD